MIWRKGSLRAIVPYGIFVDGLRQTDIGDFQSALMGYKDIFWLQIEMMEFRFWPTDFPMELDHACADSMGKIKCEFEIQPWVTNPAI